MNRVIIPCGGDGTRWGNYLGIPKQLIKYDDHETILERTIRLCHRPDVEKVYVTTNDSRIAKVAGGLADVVPVPKAPNPAPVDKVLSSEALWINNETVILFGDVYFTEAAIETIMQHQADNVVFFGRLGVSELTGKKGSEIYGVKFSESDISSLKNHCKFIKWSAHAGHLRPKLALMKMVMASMVASAGLHDDQYNWTAEHYDTKYVVKIDDRTEDFDCPRDYLNWRALS